jgi:hypothetical protein
MATIATMITCAVAEGFLLYVLTQFARELRKARAGAATAAIPASRATGGNTSRGREFGKVVEIAYGSRVPPQTSSRRLAS